MRRGIRAAAHADVRGSRTADVSVKAVAAGRDCVSLADESAARHIEWISQRTKSTSHPVNERELLDVVVLERAVLEEIVVSAEILNEDAVLLRLITAVLHGGVENL